jgi:hypothetical protein
MKQLEEQAMAWLESQRRPTYVQEGLAIHTHSMLETFGRCPKKAQYKYVDRLKKRVLTERDKPLSRGTWFHRLLELYYVGKDWKAEHKRLTAKFNQLFDEEKDSLGDLPAECWQLMQSYLWHYGANKDDPYHGWEVIDTELKLECPWPDGKGIYRCRIDLLARDRWGLWIIDHKTHKRLPTMTFRLLDHASARYIWCARENGLDVRGFMWNYIRTKPPTKPQLAYANDPNRRRLSTKTIDTDFPTMYRAIKEYDLDIETYRSHLIALKRQRWRPDTVQTSPFFRRDLLEKDDDMLTRVVAASMRTRDRMDTYEWDDSVERVVDQSCNWCDFGRLCEAELFGGDGQIIRRQQFRTGDPLDYYQEQKPVDVD